MFGGVKIFFRSAIDIIYIPGGLRRVRLSKKPRLPSACIVRPAGIRDIKLANQNIKNAAKAALRGIRV
jgi:hypothetical protein